MTKLADAIRRSTRVDAPQIGFSPLPTKVRATMLLVALTSATGKASTEGADLVLIQGKGAAASSNGQSPVMRGLWMQDGNGDAAAARQQGFEFIVFGADDAPASILLEEEAGLVMAVQEELPDSLLQALQWLPLDALLVRWDGGVTVRRQLELQRLSGFARKPLLLVVENEPKAAELEALREAGVVGVVVDLTGTGGEARLKTLRATIDGLRPRPRRSRSDSQIVSVSPATITAAAESDDDDDDNEE
jgi:hypothetical protein